MICEISLGTRKGEVTIPASKSQAHRQLICAALSAEPSVIYCDGMSKDIEATIACLNGAGADISFSEGRIEVGPIKKAPLDEVDLYCGESGSTLRFMIPVIGALGVKGVFHMEGRLPERPIEVFTDELTAHGMKIEKDGDLLRCAGKLSPGDYTIPGNISSQFITGLLLSLPLLEKDSRIVITEGLESVDYIAMTEDALKLSKISFEKKEMLYEIPGGQRFSFPKEVRTESDWSNAAFFICMGALSKEGILLHGLNTESSQGDRRILKIAEDFGADISFKDGDIFVKRGELKGQIIDASDVPDLVPTISSMAAAASGETRIIKAERLRIKESDRLAAVNSVLGSLGADIEETPDGLIIKGKEKLTGGTVDSFGDHRIAMAAAVAAVSCSEPVTIEGAECVKKSYPAFWEDFGSLEVEE